MCLVKLQRGLTPEEHAEARLWSLWLLYGKCPSKVEPDVDGSYSLGEIGEVKLEDQRIDRWSPYAVAKGPRS